MTRVTIIGICGLLMASSSIAQLKCGQNEMEVQCAIECAADYCPKSKEVQSCPMPVSCSGPVCKCIFDHRRADNGSCIPTVHCPPFECGPNEVYTPCPPACPDECSYSTSYGGCPLTFPIVSFNFVLPCVPACRCVDSFWRHGGKCVPYNQCP